MILKKIEKRFLEKKREFQKRWLLENDKHKNVFEEVCRILLVTKKSEKTKKNRKTGELVEKKSKTKF